MSDLTTEYAMAYFEAIRSVSYIVDAGLRDDMMRELVMINRRLIPNKPQSNLVQQHSSDGGVGRNKRIATANS